MGKRQVSGGRNTSRWYKALVLVLSSVLLLSISGFLFRLLEYRSAATEYAEIAHQMDGAYMQTNEPACTPENTAVPLPAASPARPVVTPPVYYSQQMRSL